VKKTARSGRSSFCDMVKAEPLAADVTMNVKLRLGDDGR
jgi:hypothetical protein